MRVCWQGLDSSGGVFFLGLGFRSRSSHLTQASAGFQHGGRRLRCVWGDSGATKSRRHPQHPSSHRAGCARAKSGGRQSQSAALRLCHTWPSFFGACRCLQNCQSLASHGRQPRSETPSWDCSVPFEMSESRDFCMICCCPQL